jgi:hypothetical protein
MNQLQTTAERRSRARIGSILILLAASVLVLARPAAVAGAEVFHLANGGRVDGQWLNRDDPHPQQYLVLLPSGGKVTLDAAQVKSIATVAPDELEYGQIRPQYPDTPEGQWKLAEWCREHRLEAQRKEHLDRIIELDPNNVQAHRALHHSQIDGEWQTQEEILEKQGLRLYKGRVRTSQEIEMLQAKRKVELAEKEWYKKVKLWRRWLGTGRNQQALDNIAAIADPMAVPALAAGMKKEDSAEVRVLYIEPLSKINSPLAPRVLAVAAIEDSDQEVRLSCLESLQKTKNPAEIVSYFIGRLRDKNNIMVRRAGVALSFMKDPSSIRPLIDALITTHEYKITTGNPGSTSTTFGRGPGGNSGMGMSAGGSTKIVKDQAFNQEVLDALITLTKKNFGFDVGTWHAWYNAQKKSEKVPDMRRD